nr:MAG TPA: hypothetical protein [Caudoviricetes sp.]
MTGIVLVLAMAVITEGLVEYAKTIGKAIYSKDFKTLSTQAAALLISVCLCVLTGADIFAPIGITFGFSWVGMVLTGVFASRGANYVSDIVRRIQSLGENSTEIEEE